MTLKKSYLKLALVALVLLISQSGAGFAGTLDSTNIKMPNLAYEPGAVLVKFKAKTTRAQQRKIATAAGKSAELEAFGPRNGQQLRRLKLKRGVSVTQALKVLRSDNNVLLADPNYRRELVIMPNDTAFNNQWGLHNTGQTIKGFPGSTDADIDAPAGWDIATTGTTIAFIDSGIDQTHPDLSGKLWQNTGEVADNGLDDDGNGYVDDIYGYNWASIAQGYFNASLSLGEGTSTPAFAQSIKGTGRLLTHIGVRLGKHGNPTGSIVVAIRTSLDGADLASFTIAPAEVSAVSKEIYKPLSTPVNLSDGSTFYIVVSTDNNDNSNFYGIYDNASTEPDYLPDPYREGQEYDYDGSIWRSYASDDLYFRTNPNSSVHDDHGHGTHVSGIAAAAGNNAQGVAGVSWGAKIMALKVGDSSGNLYSSDIIQAIYYAADNGAKVINMSFVGPDSSAPEQDAINYAAGKKVVMFAAVGNDYDGTINYPAAYNNVIGVGATTNQDQRADFSNYNTSVDISAPGRDIYSTMPTYPAALNSLGYNQNYDFISGTSMASPMAAGVAALLLAQRPALTPAQVEQVMEDNADDKGAPGYDNQFGSGRINAERVLNRSAWFTAQSWPEAGVGAWPAAGNKLAAGDFNNDGYQDIVSFYNYPATRQVKAWVWLNDGAGNYNNPQMWWDSGPGNWDWAGTKLAVGDFDNNGQDDLVAFYGYAAQRQTRAWVFTTSGSSFNPPTVWWDSGPGNWDWDGTNLQVGDYNGNGATDLLAFYGYAAQRQARAFVFTAAAAHFNAPTVWWDSGPNNWDMAGAKLSSGDYTGDNKDDFLAFYAYFATHQTKAIVFSAGTNNFTSGFWWDSGPNNWDWGGTKLASGNFDTSPGSDIAALYGYSGNQTRIFVFGANPGGNQFNAPTTWWDSGPGAWNWSATTLLSGNVSGAGAIDELLGFYDYGSNNSKVFSFN